MKSQMVMAAVLLSVVGLAATPAHAQSSTVQVKIPFHFTISEKTLPAGDYLLMTGPHQFKIADARNRVVAIVLANEVSDRPAGKQGRIVFHCSGRAASFGKFGLQCGGMVAGYSPREARLSRHRKRGDSISRFSERTP